MNYHTFSYHPQQKTITRFYFFIMVLIHFSILPGSIHAVGTDTTELKQPDIEQKTFFNPSDFKKLDNANSFNKNYQKFDWNTSKLVIMFANPVLTEDSLKYNSRVFSDISSKQSYLSFLTEEIVETWWRNSDFVKVEWNTLPIQQKAKIFTFKKDVYKVALPDSPLVSYRNTGCRFVLLLQQFTPRMQIRHANGTSVVYQVDEPKRSGSTEYNGRFYSQPQRQLVNTYDKNGSLLYLNVAPEATRNENLAQSFIDYSFAYTYILYDLLESEIVQFGKAFDENQDHKTKIDDLKHCLNDALMDVIEISKFKRKQ